MSAEASSALIRALPVDQAAALLRRAAPATVARLMQNGADDAARRALRRLLESEPNSAGALMDPLVLALPETIDVAAALERIRLEPEHAMYYIYVVDADGHLTGVVNVRGLMLSESDAPLRSIMRPKPDAIPAQAGREAIAGHPAWQRVHALPVVDRNGLLLGAIRYEIVRRLEVELGLSTRVGRDRATAVALAELYALGLSGIAEFATSTVGQSRRPARGGPA
jgi:magnesium transporter